MSKETDEFIPAHSSKRFVAPEPLDEEPLDVPSLGQGIRLESGRKILFDRAAAERLLNCNEVPGDRGLDNELVRYLMLAMERRTFLYDIVSLAVCYCKETGVEYRVNGQHCAWSVLELFGKVPPGRVSWLRYEAVTLEDVRFLYSSFDRGRGRGKGNVIHSYLAGSKGFEALSAQALKVLAVGFAFWYWPTFNERRRHDGDDIAFLLKKDHHPLAERVAAFFASSRNLEKQRFLRRSPVVASMFGTFAKVPTKAEEFWSVVRDGVGLTARYDPRLTLRDGLQGANLRGNAEIPTRGGGRTVLPDDMYAWCVNAWNAWRRGEELRTLRGTINGARPTIR